MSDNLHTLMGINYTLKTGEKITMSGLDSNQHPVPIGKTKVGVYVLQGSVSAHMGTYTFILSRNCKRHLRAEALPDSIKEKLAWALTQNPKDPYGEVLPKDRDWSGIPEDDLGLRIDGYRCVVFLTRDEYYWLNSKPLQKVEEEFIVHGKIPKDYLHDT
jgi:hypothetical protein